MILHLMVVDYRKPLDFQRYAEIQFLWFDQPKAIHLKKRANNFIFLNFEQDDNKLKMIFDQFIEVGFTSFYIWWIHCTGSKTDESHF